MSSNVGLSTPRGSGTSGYVQRNLSTLKPRATGYGQPYTLDSSARPPKIRKPDQDILRHDRLREIEVKVAQLQDKLEEEGKLDEDEIEKVCDEERERLVREMERPKESRDGQRGKMKSYQVHELAEAKNRESEKLRRALGLKRDEAGDGDGEREHPMARQERRKRQEEIERDRRDREEENRHVKRERDRSNDRRRRDDDD